MEPADELMTRSMLVVGALTTAADSRSTVVLDATATVVVGAAVVVVGRVVVTGRAVVRGAAVVSGGSVAGGSVVGVVGGVVAAGRVVVVVVVVVELVVVLELDVELVEVVVVELGSPPCAYAVPTNTPVNSSTNKPKTDPTRVLLDRGGRLTGILILLKR